MKAVISYGRFQPPHRGHQKLMDTMLNQEGDPFLVISHRHDPVSNPLSQDFRQMCLETMAPGITVVHSDKSCPTLFKHMGRLWQLGYRDCTVVLGQDRLQEMESALMFYNGRMGPKDPGYDFSNLNFASAGMRQGDPSTPEGISASQMREWAIHGNLEAFSSGLAENLRGKEELIFAEVRKGLGLQESYDFRMG